MHTFCLSTHFQRARRNNSLSWFGNDFTIVPPDPGNCRRQEQSWVLHLLLSLIKRVVLENIIMIGDVWCTGFRRILSPKKLLRRYGQ